MESVSVNPQIDQSWKNRLQEEFNAAYFADLKEFLKEERKKHIVYPPGKNIFSAFNYTPFEKVKVVIIGQDPYHGPGQANGLCFSVSPGIPLPPSLKNIFKELKNDLGFAIPSSGDLTKWATQGILLLNATLTVRHSEAGSHSKKGWEKFTNAVIKKISDEKKGVIFLLWGKYAQAKKEFIDQEKHFILEAAHPSPLSAHNGFFGCKHFSKTNDILIREGKEPIDWQIG